MIEDDDFFCNDAWDSFTTEIFVREYELVTAKDVVVEQHIRPTKTNIRTNHQEVWDIVWWQAWPLSSQEVSYQFNKQC